MTFTDAPPNVLVIVTHDSGRHFGCYGIETVETPNIDLLAEQGIRYTNVWAACPMCSPSRGAMMTGRYPQANGLTGLCHGKNPSRLNANEQHLAAIMKENGYESILARFHHEDLWENWRELGYERFIAQETTFFSETVPPEKALTAPRSADRIVKYLAKHSQQNKTKPFFLSFGMFESHTPFDYGGVKISSDKAPSIPPHVLPTEKAVKHYAGLEAQIEQADKAVGKIITALDNYGLSENTLVIFTVDHGIEGVRDKWQLYDPGLAIPLIMRWPGHIKAGQLNNHLVANVDIAPSILEATGLPIPNKMQGHSLWPATTADTNNEHVYAAFGSARCVRSNDWKLIASPSSIERDKFPGKIDAAREKTETWELYNLSQDPLESVNRINDPRCLSLAHNLKTTLVNWMRSCDDHLTQDVENLEIKPNKYSSMQTIS